MTPCPQCNRTSYMYMSTCQDCNAEFCDDCSEAASELSGGIEHKSATVTVYAPTCPKCGSSKVEWPAASP